MDTVLAIVWILAMVLYSFSSDYAQYFPDHNNRALPFVRWGSLVFVGVLWCFLASAGVRLCPLVSVCVRLYPLARRLRSVCPNGQNPLVSVCVR